MPRNVRVDRAHASATDDPAGALANAAADPMGSTTTPLKTIHRPVDGRPRYEQDADSVTDYAAENCAVADDVIWINDGTYPDIRTIGGGADQLLEGEQSLAYNPANAGASGQPIIFRKVPGAVVNIGRTVGSAASLNYPVIGATGTGKNHIQWNGFVLQLGSDVLLRGPGTSGRLTGLIVENLTVTHQAVTAGAGGNYNCVRQECVDGAVVRYSTLKNSTYSDSASHNASCSTLYGCINCRLYECDLFDSNSGFYDKDFGGGGTGAGNWMYQCYLRGHINPVRVDAVNVYGAGHGGSRYFQNVYYDHEGIGGPAILYGTLDTWDDLQVYSSTFYGFGWGVEMRGPHTNFKHHNNCIVVDGVTSGFRQIVVNIDAATPSGWNSDYNWHHALLGGAIRFCVDYDSLANITLAQWRARGSPGYDNEPSTNTGDPSFVGTIEAAAAVGVFKLTGGSSLRGAGRVGGVGAGAAIDIGACPNGDSDAVGRPLDGVITYGRVSLRKISR